MNRKRAKDAKTRQHKSALAIFLVFGVATLVVGVGLLGMRRHTLSQIEAARQWAPTLAVVERAAMVRREEGSVLALEYRYEFQGKTYRSDRLDLLPGRMGDDSSWEERMLARFPAGSRVTCYVDPANPQMAVLDREHGSEGARNLRLMAIPFIVMAAAFLFAAARCVLEFRSDVRDAHEQAAAQSTGTLGDAPRRLKLGTALAILVNTPQQMQLAWGFFVGFAIVFTFMEGPAALRELWPWRQVRANGEVTRVEGLQQWEVQRQVFEYEFRYEREGEARTGKSHTVGQWFNVGDPVEIVLDPQRPDSASIAGTRRREVPWYARAIPLGVMFLLGVGIVGNSLFNVRALNLVRIGHVATATRRAPQKTAKPVHTAASQDQPAEYEFRLGKQTYPVDCRSWANSRAETIPVLYDPRRPARNVVLDARRWAMLTGAASPWPLCLAGLIVPVACVAALMWLWGGP